jgi:hypothetical protein
MQNFSRFLAAAAGIACAASLAFAAEQTILGRSLTVKDPKPGVDATKRRIASASKEKGSSATIVGDPTLAGSAGGAILQVFAFGATSSNQSFVLPQGTSSTGKPFWTATDTIGPGFKYKDPKGDNGPVESVRLKRSPSGKFSIEVEIAGKNGEVNVVPPNPGTSGCVALKLGIAASAGDRYSLQFGPDSQFTQNSAKLFKAKKPQFEGVCPGGGPTTTTTTSTTTTMVTTTTSSTSTTAPTVPTTTTTTSTTTTTLYGSPSRAFLARAVDLLD